MPKLENGTLRTAKIVSAWAGAIVTDNQPDQDPSGDFDDDIPF